jgi:hypothetical protein
MRNSRVFGSIALLVLTFALMAAIPAKAQVNLLAIGAFTDSRAGYYKDLSGLRYNLENGAAANLLGGLGSAIAWASGNTFLALPDRGPNAVSFNSLIDDTVTHIPRFHTLTVDLEPGTGGSLPFTRTPTLDKTTLLFSGPSRVYGNGAGLNVGPGVSSVNTPFEHYFSGGSDNFDPSRNSGDPRNARMDSEGTRLSSSSVSPAPISADRSTFPNRSNRSEAQTRDPEKRIPI